MKNKSLILTLLLALNSCSLYAAESHNTEQQEQSWKNYLPTKKQVFIGACTIAAGATLWYMRKKISPASSMEIDLKPLIGNVKRQSPLSQSSKGYSGIDHLLAGQGSCNYSCIAFDDQLYRLDTFHFCILDKKIVSKDHKCNFFTKFRLHVDLINRWKMKIEEIV